MSLFHDPPWDEQWAEEPKRFLQAVFPGAKIASDGRASTFVHLGPDWLVLTPENGGLRTKWSSDQILVPGMVGHVVRDRKFLRTAADLVGWTSLIRTRLTEKALKALRYIFYNTDFLNPVLTTPKSGAIGAITFLMGWCALSFDEVATLLTTTYYEEHGQSLFFWHQTAKGNWGMRVHTKSPGNHGAIGFKRLELVDDLVDDFEGQYTYKCVLKIPLGCPNPLISASKCWDINLTTDFHARTDAEAKRAAGHLLVSRGIQRLGEWAKTYLEIQAKVKTG